MLPVRSTRSHSSRCGSDWKHPISKRAMASLLIATSIRGECGPATETLSPHLAFIAHTGPEASRWPSRNSIHIDLPSNTAEGIRAQDKSLAGFACREDEIVGQQHRPLRSQVLVSRVFSFPVRRRKPILQSQGGRELQYRVAVIPLALGDRAVA